MAAVNHTRTFPLAWLDDVQALNCQLEAFQTMLLPWVRSQLHDSGDGSSEAIARGMDLMLQAVLDGYRGIERNMDVLNEAHRRISHEGHADAR